MQKRGIVCDFRERGREKEQEQTKFLRPSSDALICFSIQDLGEFGK